MFIPVGNTGGYYSLSNEERAAVVRTTVETVDGATVVGGAGGSTKTALSLIDKYADAGSDLAMIMPPSHTYVHQQGFNQYYEYLAAESELPLILYKRGPELSDEAIAKLSKHDNIVGVKYTVNDIDAFSGAVTEAPGNVAWFNGLGDRFAPSYALEGATGFTTGIGNALPNVTLALFNAICEEDWSAARRLRNALKPLEDLRAETGSENSIENANNVPVVKYCMERAGMYGGPVREPLVNLSQKDQRRADQYFDRAK